MRQIRQISLGGKSYGIRMIMIMVTILLIRSCLSLLPDSPRSPFFPSWFCKLIKIAQTQIVYIAKGETGERGDSIVIYHQNGSSSSIYAKRHVVKKCRKTFETHASAVETRDQFFRVSPYAQGCPETCGFAHPGAPPEINDESASARQP